MNEIETQFEPFAIDRVRELVNIGAGHAACALGQMLGATCRMRVPLVRVLPTAAAGAPFASGLVDDEGAMSGVFFEIRGGLGGVLALLFSKDTEERLIHRLLADGRPRSGEAVDSALRELGNILISHVASAMADTLGVAVIPSIPILAPSDARSVLGSLVAARRADGGVVRIETEISDSEGRVRSVLAFVPDDTTVIARPEGF
jgi:chemotaxis protein CheC